jgi:hypothetical protein
LVGRSPSDISVRQRVRVGNATTTRAPLHRAREFSPGPHDSIEHVTPAVPAAFDTNAWRGGRLNMFVADVRNEAVARSLAAQYVSFRFSPTFSRVSLRRTMVALRLQDAPMSSVPAFPSFGELSRTSAWRPTRMDPAWPASG